METTGTVRLMLMALRYESRSGTVADQFEERGAYAKATGSYALKKGFAICIGCF